MTVCAGCTCRIGNRYSAQSGLHSPARKFILCAPCFVEESALIKRSGTNNLPDVIEKYVNNLAVHERGNW